MSEAITFYEKKTFSVSSYIRKKIQKDLNRNTLAPEFDVLHFRLVQYVAV